MSGGRQVAGTSGGSRISYLPLVPSDFPVLLCSLLAGFRQTGPTELPEVTVFKLVQLDLGAAGPSLD